MLFLETGNKKRASCFVMLALCLQFCFSTTVNAQMLIATTTLEISICGNEIIDDGEECDVLGETGDYSTTIVGRQCDLDCSYGPYCGDAILQTIYGEECDDGNNNDNDFCSAICTIEPAFATTRH